MSWIKNNNVTINSVKSLNFNNGNTNNNNNNSYLKDFDLSACYDSFKKHWQQIHEIIRKYEVSENSDILLAVTDNFKYSFVLIFTVGFISGTKTRRCFDSSKSPESSIDVDSGRITFRLYCKFVHRILTWRELSGRIVFVDSKYSEVSLFIYYY